MIYPVEVFCFSKTFDWALSSELVKYLNFHYEVWSKGGKGPGFSVENQEYYIRFLNWVPNWISVYFFGKFTDYIFVILLILFIFSAFYFKEIFFKNKKFHKKNSNFLVFYCLLLAVFLLWFLNFPTLRYAGYIIIFLLIIIPYLIHASKKINFSKKDALKKLTIIFLISYSIFFTKNTLRINDELKLKESEHNNFKNFPFFWVENKEFKRIFINNHELYLTDGACWNVPSTCIRDVDSLKITKKNNYIFYSIK